MGKRSSFERRERDFYPTPKAAVEPLLRFLPPRARFFESCAGDGALATHLTAAGHICLGMTDIMTGSPVIAARDALTLTGLPTGAFFVTNPPWDVAVLHPLIAHLSQLAPTWLLLYADWMHTRQAAPYMPLAKTIVSVGRVKWIAGSKHTGKDNAVWALSTLEMTHRRSSSGAPRLRPRRRKSCPVSAFSSLPTMTATMISPHEAA